MTMDEKLDEIFSQLTDEEKKEMIIYADSLLKLKAPHTQAS
jgi:hypothetical protein